MPTWPTSGSFPQLPMFEGYSEQTPNAVLRTQMDTGPAKVRRRTTAAPRPFHVQFPLTTSQVATLDTFFMTTCEAGALAFDWSHPRTGSAGSFRFVGQIKYQRYGADLWTAVFDVEQVP